MEVRNNMQNIAFKQNLLAYSTTKSLRDADGTLDKVISWALRAEDSPVYGEPIQISLPGLFGSAKNAWLVPDKNTPIGKVLGIIVDRLKLDRENIKHYIPCDAEDGIGHIIADTFSFHSKATQTSTKNNKFKTALGKVLSLIRTEYIKAQTSRETSSDAVQNLFDRVVDFLIKDKTEIIPVNLDKPMPVV